MQVLFEDDGQLKAGTVLADNDTSLQVEAASGKRVKVKAANVLLRFTEPGAAALLPHAQQLAAELDPGFLWEAGDDDEFGFSDLAREYYGHPPRAEEATAVALLLHASPMYFYKRGKGRYRRAPADALKAAIASVERKRREAEQIADWVASLRERQLPDGIKAKLGMLLHRPDKTTPEWRALAAAADAEHLATTALLAACGAIPSSHDYHYQAFLLTAFPRGEGFGHWGTLPEPADLALAESIAAFSIDDATTTEIDDAFSVTALADGHWRIGIHIAAPAVAIPRGSALDALARERLSTVYMPGRKITMLPEPVIAAYTLAQSTAPPALSLYVETRPDGSIVGYDTRVERVPIAANLRLDTVSEAFAADPADPAVAEPPWTAELRVLWRFVCALAQARGKPEFSRTDYSFYVDWDAAPEGRVAIVPRPRGSPLDKLVSELMIFVNSTWGRVLAQARTVGLYRTQSNGKVRMSTRPGEHQGLGLAHYLWASSPLRRYSDLVNQRQLLAVAQGEKPPYQETDAELFGVLADFEATYASYAEFQSRMEYYWCLRWLAQEGVETLSARVIRDTLVRCTTLPLVLKLADLPALPADTEVRLAVGRIDLLAPALEVRYAGTAP